MKILALDYGGSRIGAAVGDTKIGIAHPRQFFRNDKNFWVELASFCATEKIEVLLVGVPVSLSGASSAQTKKVKTFIVELNRVTKLPVFEIDERFSTKIAQVNLHLRELKSHEHKNFIDSEAARILLQEYLERH